MANHKRRRPKHQRAGCLMCKPHKDERGKGKDDFQTRQERRASLDDPEIADLVTNQYDESDLLPEELRERMESDLEETESDLEETYG